MCHPCSNLQQQQQPSTTQSSRLAAATCTHHWTLLARLHRTNGLRGKDLEVVIGPPSDDAARPLEHLPSAVSALPDHEPSVAPDHPHHHFSGLKRAMTLAQDLPVLRSVRKQLRKVPRPLLLLCVFSVVMSAVFLVGAFPAFWVSAGWALLLAF